MKTSNDEVVRYSAGADGFRNVSDYDAVRYASPANRYKLQVMANAYNRMLGPLAGKRVLDVGCGTGRGVVRFAATASVAVGVDASCDMLAAARRNAGSGPLPGFVAGIAQHLPFPDKYFDVVASLNFLHLFSNQTQAAMIAEMIRVARPGAILVLEFDNALQGVVLGLHKRWRGTERGSFPGEIRRALGDACRIQAIYGAVFPVLWRLFYRWPRIFAKLEKVSYVFPFNRLSHRIYYKVFVPTSEPRPAAGR